MIKIFIAVVLFYLVLPLNGQAIIGVGTRYSDSFREWIITTDNEEIEGKMRIRWAFRNDWTEWDVTIGDLSATIEQKWHDDPNLWEIHCNGVVVNAKTTWPNEFNRWKLTDGKNQINWGTRYVNIRDDWRTDDRDDEDFRVYTYWEGDPREWVVEDNLPAEVSDAMRIAMIFLALHFSTPKI